MPGHTLLQVSWWWRENQNHLALIALLKIQNDISTAANSGEAVALKFLDLSAAFDVMNHSVLIDCLKDWLGVDCTVLSWNTLFLTNRKQKIN